MINKIKSPSRIFIGWWTVLFTGILSGMGHGFCGYGLTIFFKDLSADLGLSRALASLGSGLSKLDGGLESAPTGWLVDKFGPKWIIFIGVCIVGFGLIIMNFVTKGWVYIVVWGGLIGLGLNLGLVVAIDKLIVTWFMKRRGLAQAVKFSLISISGIIIIPIVTWMVITFGWRITCLMWGILLLAVSPLILIFVKQKGPEYYGLNPDGSNSDNKLNQSEVAVTESGDIFDTDIEIDFTLKQVLKTRSYWLLVLSWVILTTVTGGIGLHMIPFLTDMGISQLEASGMVTLMVAFVIPARFIGGFAADYFNKRQIPYVMAAIFSLETIGITAIVLTQSTVSIFVFLILHGLCSGACTPLLTVTLARYFGIKSFGTIFGILRACQGPFALMAPVYAGWVYDSTGSYATAFTLYSFITVAAVLCVCMVRPPTLPVQAL
ncbi:MFS transporter [Thermodesulfobacteriota bacterium]